MVVRAFGMEEAERASVAEEEGIRPAPRRVGGRREEASLGEMGVPTQEGVCRTGKQRRKKNGTLVVSRWAQFLHLVQTEGLRTVRGHMLIVNS